MDRAAFVSAARGMIGTPFRHQGRLPGVGLDCAGLVVCALRHVGIEVPDVAGYGRLPRHNLFLGQVEANCTRIPHADASAGDLLMFRWTSEPQHVAIYAGGGSIVHAYQAARGVVEHDLDDIWRGRLMGTYWIKH